MMLCHRAAAEAEGFHGAAGRTSPPHGGVAYDLHAGLSFV